MIIYLFKINIMRNKIYNIFFKKGKQYSLILPYIKYWGCDDYHWLRFYKNTYLNMLGDTINNNILFTILFNKGKISIGKD